MNRPKSWIDYVPRLLFRGIGLVFVIGMLEAVLLFLIPSCRWNSDSRKREEHNRSEAKQQYERERAEAKRAGTDPNSAVRKLNSGKWLQKERKAAK